MTTDLGRAIAIVLLVAGVGFVSLITGALAQRFTRTEAAEAATTDALLQELRALRARVEEIEAARSQPNPGRTA